MCVMVPLTRGGLILNGTREIPANDSLCVESTLLSVFWLQMLNIGQ